LARIIVTGINGFVGKHLARELYSRHHQIIGVGREAKPNPELQTILADYVICDLTEPEAVSTLPIEGLDSIINLAGLAKVGDSFKNPEIYNQVNVSVLTVLGNRLVKQKSQARVIAISTGAVYDPDQKLPLTEDSGITVDGSPYALSKLLMEEAAAELRAEGLECVVVRPFNHIGPGQEPGFLVPDLYQKIANSIKTGEPVEVGNLKTKRDYTDVRDVVKAYADLAEAPSLAHDLYNVCSSKSITGQEILRRLLELMGPTSQVEIRVNPEFIRASDPPDLYGSYSRLNQQTGWRPVIDLATTLADFVKSQTQ
jgi:GDP-4-dehydro-6-deoxy-D-mannose reductase